MRKYAWNFFFCAKKDLAGDLNLRFSNETWSSANKQCDTKQVQTNAACQLVTPVPFFNAFLQPISTNFKNKNREYVLCLYANL